MIAFFTRELSKWLGFAMLYIGMAIPAVTAAPWMDPGDSRLRHHIQVLADAALIRVPVNTWPLMWSGVMNELGLIRGKVLTPAQRRAVAYISQSFDRQTNTLNHHVSASVAEQIDPVQGFATPRRGEQSVTLGSEYLADTWAGRLQVSWVDDPIDNKRYRYDGSYIAALLGNWAVSVGALDRWWGPGRETALIWSNNTRPIPGVSIQRNNSAPFNTWLLRWLGPWQLVVFAGKLEEERFVPNTTLLGMRINFRPASWLELGLSRTAQWGGDGRPQSWDSFFDAVVGKENYASEDAELAQQPGNQLAGIDWRASWAKNAATFSFYGELIGEDEAGFLPSRRIVTLGLDGAFSAWGSDFRVYLEASDTASERRYATARYDYTYEHAAYRSGYRYRGRAIGASIDNDTRAHHLGLQWYPDARQSVTIKLAELDFRPNARGTDSVTNTGSAGYSVSLDYRYDHEAYYYGIGYRHYDGELKLQHLDTADDGIELTVGRRW